MTSGVSASAGFAAWTAQRVEVYTLVAGPDGAPLLATGGAGTEPRVPGAVLAHGEHPRDAALRALDGAASIGGAALIRTDALRLRQVLSDVRGVPDAAPEHLSGMHVLRLLFEVPGHGPAPQGFDPALLREPDVAPVAERLPGAPPRVQRPAAYAVVVHDGEALLSRVTGHGVWTLPGGGIDHGEHPDDAVRRETFEETGLELAEAQLVDVDSRHFTGRSPAQVTEDFHGVRILYRGVVAERREPVVQEIGGSTDAAAWVPLDRLGQLRLTDIARTTLHRER